MRNTIHSVGDHIDCILFLVNLGRLSSEEFNFILLFQEQLFKNKLNNNSIIIFTGKKFQNNLLNNNFNQAFQGLKSFDFDLRYDDHQDDIDDRKKNIEKRQKTIDGLLNFLNNQELKKIDLSHIHSADFQKKWEKEFIVKIQNFNTKMNAEKSFSFKTIKHFIFRLFNFNSLFNFLIFAPFLTALIFSGYLTLRSTHK